ncbi:hypothetical protein ACET3Z_017929 [Daucus carota]
MAYDQTLQVRSITTADVSLGQHVKPVSDATTSENLNGYFDCNICLDTARDPVVTLCGHLYCWPCIYKWLHVVRSSLESDKQPDCPVCKARISETSLVPLYGRGDTCSDPDAKQPLPRRPPGVRAETMAQEQSQYSPLEPHQQPFHPQHYFSHPLANYPTLSPPNIVTAGMISPTVGMFGEMVYARIFGSSDTSLFSYPHAYPLVHNSSPNPRIRRQELQSENRPGCIYYVRLREGKRPTLKANGCSASSGGACGYDNTFHAGFGVNTAAVSGALFRSGEACGACYQVMCNFKLDPKWCLRRALVTVTATNFCPPNNNGGWCDYPRHHFDMSMPAFFRMARRGDEGIVPVLYRR